MSVLQKVYTRARRTGRYSGIHTEALPSKHRHSKPSVVRMPWSFVFVSVRRFVRVPRLNLRRKRENIREQRQLHKYFADNNKPTIHARKRRKTKLRAKQSR